MLFQLNKAIANNDMEKFANFNLMTAYLSDLYNQLVSFDTSLFEGNSKINDIRKVKKDTTF